MNMDEFEPAVGESFTNLAFEAMEKIISVSPVEIFFFHNFIGYSRSNQRIGM